MIPGFGKQTLTIGSSSQCDIVLHGEGVASEHGHLRHDGAGKLSYTALAGGTTYVEGSPIAVGQSVAFDFRQRFVLGTGTELPFDHPAITLSLMTKGNCPIQSGKLVIGRDPNRVGIVLGHPSISSHHCSVDLNARTLIDHNSTSGTYLAGARLESETPTPLAANSIVHVGPVPVRLSLLQQIATASQPAASPAADEEPAHSPQRRKHKTVFGQLDFTTAGGTKRIGRTADNDIVVPHPQVSSKHAEVECRNGQLFVTDRGSANGTYIRGRRVHPNQPIQIASGEKIYVGPMPLQLVMDSSGSVEVVHEAEYAEDQWAGRPLYDVEAWSLLKEVVDRDDSSKMKVLLQDISFKAMPGDMIALMGPSGAGKTTLLLTLNGYMPPTQGMVRINGEDLYDIYDLLRGSIGYVPQDDLVHPELTVREAVRYSAKFRLPPDYSEDEIDARVQQTLRDLGLESVADLQIGAPEKKILSGGQRKRVNIALELVTDPVIVYLDEPTSGLAADDAASLIDLLSKLTRATGKTIIMTIHQPAKEEYEKFTHSLILGYGGVPMFFGRTTPDSYRFFSGSWRRRNNNYVEPTEEELVDNPRDMFANITAREDPIYQHMLAQNPHAHRAEARHHAALLWSAEFYSSSNPIYKRMYTGKREVGTAEGSRGVPDRTTSTRGQLGLLFSRYYKTKIRDKGGTLIMLAQAPVIGALLALVFGGQADEAPAWCLGALRQIAQLTGQKASGDIFSKLQLTQDRTGAVFFLVVSAIWFGTSNAAREIVKERAIYLRERMVNLGLFNYLMSKFLLLSIFCVIQCTLLLVIVFVALGFHGGPMAFVQQLAALTTTAITAVALGLLLSTLVASSEAAMALTPIALIPQVVLGGLMVPATTIPKLSVLMYAIPARWGFEAAVVPERLAISDSPAWLIDLGTTKTSTSHFILNGKFQCALAQMASGPPDDANTLSGAWSFTSYESAFVPYAVLWGMTFAILMLIIYVLARRDRV